MKTFSLRAVSRFLFSTVMVFGLIVLAGFAGVGIAAFFAYHELGGNLDLSRPSRSAKHAERAMTPRLVSLSQLEMWQGEKISMNVEASLAANRFVAAGASDQAHFSYADYQPDEPKRARKSVVAPTTTVIPPPLDPVSAHAADAQAPGANDEAPVHLSDPGSRYIMDERTGRIIGIDGSVGARAEARQPVPQQAALLPSPSRSREVRSALPVDAKPDSDLPPPKPDLYPAIRRAMLVDDMETDIEAPEASSTPSFNAAAEVADNVRPVRRAEPVMITPRARTQPRGFVFP